MHLKLSPTLAASYRPSVFSSLWSSSWPWGEQPTQSPDKHTNLSSLSGRSCFLPFTTLSTSTWQYLYFWDMWSLYLEFNWATVTKYAHTSQLFQLLNVVSLSSQVVCGLVAALLQYLFLSAFCWMMCEGVMLYLMLIVVFSRLSNKWWIFLILGYCEC